MKFRSRTWNSEVRNAVSRSRFFVGTLNVTFRSEGEQTNVTLRFGTKCTSGRSGGLTTQITARTSTGSSTGRDFRSVDIMWEDHESRERRGIGAFPEICASEISTLKLMKSVMELAIVIDRLSCVHRFRQSVYPSSFGPMQLKNPKLWSTCNRDSQSPTGKLWHGGSQVESADASWMTEMNWWG